MRSDHASNLGRFTLLRRKWDASIKAFLNGLKRHSETTAAAAREPDTSAT